MIFYWEVGEDGRATVGHSLTFFCAIADRRGEGHYFGVEIRDTENVCDFRERVLS